jgi:hypothetical protein
MRMDQISLGFSGGFWPAKWPLFQGEGWVAMASPFRKDSSLVAQFMAVADP